MTHQQREHIPAPSRRPGRLHLGLALLIALALAPAGRAQAPTALTGTVPGAGLVVTVTEGPHEPRSIGSYALRLYTPLDPA